MSEPLDLQWETGTGGKIGLFLLWSGAPLKPGFGLSGYF